MIYCHACTAATVAARPPAACCRQRNMAALLLLAALAASLMPSAHAHGYMSLPKSRSWVSYSMQEGVTYCPHCGQGNGGTPTICGDPFQVQAASPPWLVALTGWHWLACSTDWHGKPRWGEVLGRS